MLDACRRRSAEAIQVITLSASVPAAPSEAANEHGLWRGLFWARFSVHSPLIAAQAAIQCGAQSLQGLYRLAAAA
jgi:hypothetical protein